MKRLITRIRGESPATAQRTAQGGARLIWLADPILVLATQIRATSVMTDLQNLRVRILSQLQQFQDRARDADVQASRISQAMEVLGALIDHVVTSMPWGANAGWKTLGRSKTSGARRPAQRVLEVARACSNDFAMSELVCVALELGFDKSTRGQDDAQIDEALAALVPLHSNAAGSLRLAEGQSNVVRNSVWTSWLAIWVSGLVMAALLAALYFVLVISLGKTSDQLYARVAALSPAATTAQSSQPAAGARLAGGLARQVTARELFVRDEVDRSLIVVSAEKLFEPREAALRPQGTELLRSIAAVLQKTPGRIQVVAHTDGVVARSARYPSDWDFSVDRARAVQAALVGLGVDSSRITSEGRANIAPLATDDDARSVSGDSRVDIVLLAGR